MGRSKRSRHQREPASWLDQARDLSKAHATYGSLSGIGLRRCLAELWRLIGTVPRDIEEAYKALSEDELTAHSLHRMAGMMADDFDWSPPMSTARHWALAIGGQLRAYDDELLRLSPTHCGPVCGPDDWYCEHGEAYVVPRRRPSRTIGGAGRNNSLTRRGLVHHRVFPGQVGSDVVDIVVVGDLSPRRASTSSRRIGGASFSGMVLNLDVREEEGTHWFRAVALAEDDAETVARHVGKAFEQGCFAVVWPELAMPPDLRSRAVDSIAGRRLEPCRSGRPRLWITGSWHEGQGDETVNRCHVYDRDGCPISIYDKMSRYHDAAIGFEDIAVGTRVPVIVTDEAIVGVAICKDFCMLDASVPGCAFPVDLVLVPSFGGETTVEAHVDAAHRLAVGSGGASCVVQQMSGHLSVVDQSRTIVVAPLGLMLAHSSAGRERHAAVDGWSSCEIGLR